MKLYVIRKVEIDIHGDRFRATRAEQVITRMPSSRIGTSQVPGHRSTLCPVLLSRCEVLPLRYLQLASAASSLARMSNITTSTQTCTMPVFLHHREHILFPYSRTIRNQSWILLLGSIKKMSHGVQLGIQIQAGVGMRSISPNVTFASIAKVLPLTWGVMLVSPILDIRHYRLSRY